MQFSTMYMSNAMYDKIYVIYSLSILCYMEVHIVSEKIYAIWQFMLIIVRLWQYIHQHCLPIILRRPGKMESNTSFLLFLATCEIYT